VEILTPPAGVRSILRKIDGVDGRWYFAGGGGELVGQTIANCRITTVLARERGRAIYAAEDLRHDRTLTIEVWQSDPSRDARMVPGLADEIRAVNALGHPNIAQVLEAGTAEDGQPYRVTEILDGETLAARLRVQACVRAAEAVAIAREVAGALAAAHAAGIVHGHLTAPSVFITLDPTAGRGERVKLLDFGIEPGLGGKALEGRADVHALGELLFEMLCGTPPSLVECADEGLPPPRSLNPDVPEPLEELILAVLTPGEGNDRFTTMAAFQRALDSLAPGSAAASAVTCPAESEETARPSLGTSAFDVPPVVPTPAPVAPAAVASATSRLLAWLRGLAAPGRRARAAAGVAVVALGFLVPILASRTGGSRPAGRTPPPAARLQAASGVAMMPAPLVPTKVLDPGPASPESPPSTDAFVGPPAQGPGERACSISIGSQPWSEVWIDGKSIGRHTPLVRYKVPCGRHTLTLKSAELAAAKSAVITLNPGRRLKRLFRFAEPETIKARP
jgi:serine/threonine-protein kinase